jgi:hypothetical protein
MPLPALALTAIGHAHCGPRSPMGWSAEFLLGNAEPGSGVDVYQASPGDAAEATNRCGIDNGDTLSASSAALGSGTPLAFGCGIGTGVIGDASSSWRTPAKCAIGQEAAAVHRLMPQLFVRPICETVPVPERETAFRL